MLQANVKHRCSLPAKQSPSCIQHNVNGDIFEWEWSLFRSRSRIKPDLATEAGMGSGTKSHCTDPRAKRCTVDASSLLAMSIVFLFPL